MNPLPLILVFFASMPVFARDIRCTHYTKNEAVSFNLLKVTEKGKKEENGSKEIFEATFSQADLWIVEEESGTNRTFQVNYKLGSQYTCEGKLPEIKCQDDTTTRTLLISKESQSIPLSEVVTIPETALEQDFDEMRRRFQSPTHSISITRIKFHYKAPERELSFSFADTECR